MNIIQDKSDLIKRSSKEYIEKKLSQNHNWKILDIGCGYNASKNANVICDVQDLSAHYENKKFIQLTEKKLPFLDKEFDFVISSHVMEHVEDLKFFISELERISSNGYIELPTKLEDNLVFENKNDHIWQMDFDDIDNILIINKRIQYIEPVLTVSSIKKFDEFFRKSLVLELEWNKSIDHKFIELDENEFVKPSIIGLVRKYLSKKIRTFIKKK
ncbi:class I SAM-dependent methyltransferase [Candidatus Pelagibacter sp.]|nr:class I SAM-dependent methyltransferase [Candidatus Pelagibacter sp.]